MSNLFDRMKLFVQRDKEFRSALYDIMGFFPHNVELYRIAFAHKSQEYKSKKTGDRPLNNERLEFLGDAVLETVVSDIVYHHFRNKREGFLTNTRSKIVSRESLGKLAKDLGIDRLIQSHTHSKAHNSFLAGNAFEAFMGAIYLDRGFDFAFRFIEHRIMGSVLDLEGVAHKEVNFKSKLLEWSQKNRILLEIKDKQLSNTSNNNPSFAATIVLEGLYAGDGKGFSKKEAHQNASKDALTRMRREPKFIDEIFNSKEKRTAMEADPCFVLPVIDEIEEDIAREAELQTERKAEQKQSRGERREQRKPKREQKPKTNPAVAEETIVKKALTAANKEVSSANKEVSSANKEVSPANKDITPANKDVVAEKKETVSVKRETVSEKKDAAPVKSAPVQKKAEEVFAKAEEILAQKEKKSAKSAERTVKAEKKAAVSAEIPSVVETVPATAATVAAMTDTVPAPAEAVTPAAEVVIPISLETVENPASVVSPAAVADRNSVEKEAVSEEIKAESELEERGAEVVEKESAANRASAPTDETAAAESVGSADDAPAVAESAPKSKKPSRHRGKRQNAAGFTNTETIPAEVSHRSEKAAKMVAEAKREKARKQAYKDVKKATKNVEEAKPEKASQPAPKPRRRRKPKNDFPSETPNPEREKAVNAALDAAYQQSNE